MTGKSKVALQATFCFVSFVNVEGTFCEYLPGLEHGSPDYESCAPPSELKGIPTNTSRNAHIHIEMDHISTPSHMLITYIQNIM